MRRSAVVTIVSIGVTLLIVLVASAFRLWAAPTPAQSGEIRFELKPGTASLQGQTFVPLRTDPQTVAAVSQLNGMISARGLAIRAQTDGSFRIDYINYPHDDVLSLVQHLQFLSIVDSAGGVGPVTLPSSP